MGLRVLLVLIVGFGAPGAWLSGAAWGGTHDHEGGHDHGHGHGGDAIRITMWDERFEVFAEHPPIVAGTPTEFVVHLTRLADGAPRTGGPLTFRCEPEHGAAEILRAIDSGDGGHQHGEHDHGDHDHGEHDHNGDHDHGDHETYVAMNEANLDRYGIELVSAAPGHVRSEIELPGEIALNGHRTAQIVARIPGMVGELNVALGDEVRAGQVVAVLISRELADAKADYLAAMQREELAAAGFAREERLRADRITSEREFIEARHGYSEARILTCSAEQKLVAMGISEEQIRGLPEEPNRLLTHFEIRAPFAGSIIERNAQRGEMVAEDTAIFKVADLRTVWLDLHVPDRELQSICTGQSVTLLEPTELRGLRGNVEYVHPIVDGRSRTVLVRVTLSNPEGLLRPGQFVTARVAAQEVTAPVVIPREAIQYLNDVPVVFVRDGCKFVAREVALGGSTSNRVAVTSGLSPGEQVAAGNSFLLKSEVEKRSAGDIGHGHPH